MPTPTDAIPGWFPESAQKRVSTLIEDYEIKTVIEIGSFVGLSTTFFASCCERVITIDTFDALHNASYLEPQHLDAAKDQYGTFLRNTIHYPNIVGIVMDSIAASHLPLEADMIYIDADHDYQAVKADIAAWSSKARRLIAGDDYHWPGVQAAVKELAGIETDGRTWWLTL